MKRYVVYEPKAGVPFTPKGAERLVFLREGFSWAAFLVPPLWLIVRRAWRGLLAWIVLVALVIAAGVAGVRPGNLFWLMLLANAVIGLEAAWFRAMSLRRRGFRPIGVVVAPSLVEAERQFFAAWEPDASPPPADALPAQPRAARPAYGRGPNVLGVFPEPEAGR
jgi:hypothetical protein